MFRDGLWSRCFPKGFQRNGLREIVKMKYSVSLFLSSMVLMQFPFA